MHSSVIWCFLLVGMFDGVFTFGIGSTLYCYRCISTNPGCGEFNWWWHWSQACPEIDDTCVKLIERKGATEIITRDCLSSMKGIRRDLPADHYEGCKRASTDVMLGHYVNNSVKELDVKMTYYDETTFCLCRFDNRCNGAISSKMALSPSLLLALVLASSFLSMSLFQSLNST